MINDQHSSMINDQHSSMISILTTAYIIAAEPAQVEISTGVLSPL